MPKGSYKRVLIIQGQIKRYRVPFFEKLSAVLLEDGVRLRVGYSDPPQSEGGARDICDLPSDYAVKVKSYWCLGNRIVWQCLLREVSAADLVVVEQANKYALNALLILCSAVRAKKVAFWGHGKNNQTEGKQFSNWLRKRTLNSVDWWFAYVDGTADYLETFGVPREKITTVQNSIDTRTLREQIGAITPKEIREEKRELGIEAGARVGLFCGTLYAAKAIPFLIESAKLVKKEIPNFHLIIAGGGEDAPLAEQAAASSGGWIHFVGPKFGTAKALTLRLGDVFLLPGAVGLVILDAFAAGLPFLTTDMPLHGPEVEYLEVGVNGLKVQHEVSLYARAVIDLLANSSLLRDLKKGAERSAQRYSIEEMVQNFHQGITRCLREA